MLCVIFLFFCKFYALIYLILLVSLPKTNLTCLQCNYSAKLVLKQTCFRPALWQRNTKTISMQRNRIMRVTEWPKITTSIESIPGTLVFLLCTNAAVDITVLIQAIRCIMEILATMQLTGNCYKKLQCYQQHCCKSQSIEMIQRPVQDTLSVLPYKCASFAFQPRDMLWAMQVFYQAIVPECLSIFS